ncbi:MAG TPA: helix-hairpin-helix domain-containing protein [Polyangiaceae bacterium]|nr:helix-hairpin-helix domain-containing protein [Polyangiaceae bacterium]
MLPAASTEREASALGGACFTPAEVDSRGDDGGGLDGEPPATRPSWIRRSREAFQGSVWAPVATKLAGLALGMLVLSGIGVASILSSASGVSVPLAGMLGSDVHAAWLASKPAASAHASAPASAASAVASAAPQSDVKSNTVAAAAGTDGAATANAAPTAGGASAGLTADGKVILNLATVEDLRHLPGVGQKRADAILALRARLGHFKHVNDLLRVKGIGVRGLKKILPHVLLDAPQTPAA